MGGSSGGCGFSGSFIRFVEGWDGWDGVCDDCCVFAPVSVFAEVVGGDADTASVVVDSSN